MAQLPGHNREGEKQDSSEERGFSTTVTLKKKKINLLFHSLKIFWSRKWNQQIRWLLEGSESAGTLSPLIKVALSEKPIRMMSRLSWVPTDQQLMGKKLLWSSLWEVEKKLLQFSYKGWRWRNDRRWLEARHFSLLPHLNFGTFSCFSIPNSNSVKTP